MKEKRFTVVLYGRLIKKDFTGTGASLEEAKLAAIKAAHKMFGKKYFDKFVGFKTHTDRTLVQTVIVE